MCGDADARASLAHASFLGWARRQAATFLKEIGRSDAAEQYDTEVAALGHLEQVCRSASGRGRFESTEIWEAARHIDDALLAERKAIRGLSGRRG